VAVSPSDVPKEREMLARVVRRLNHGACGDRQLVLDEYRWEVDGYAAFHPQGFQRGVLDPILNIAEADIVVGIFWARLGTPDPKLHGMTGSQHELEAALVRLQGSHGEVPLHVAVYHNTLPAPISRSDKGSRLQRDELWRYLEQLEARRQGFVQEYAGPDQFEHVLQSDLENWLRKHFQISDHREPTRHAAPRRLEEEDLGRYRVAAEAAHCTIELAGFQTRLRVPIHLEELHVPLHALVDLRIQGEAAFANAEDAARRLRGPEGARIIALSEALREVHQRNRRGLVILGDPGSGKTTQLKRLVLLLLREGCSGLGLGNDKPLLPVFVRLREVRDGSLDLGAVIEQQLAALQPDLPPAFGKVLFQRGHLLLLFDGLDEVADANGRVAVARAIERLTRQYPSCIPVVTCRFAGYGEKARLDHHFLELHLRPLSSEQAEQFIFNWYRIVETALSVDPATGQGLARDKARSLVERLREPDFRTARLVQMTRNPLLLANLCLVHRDRGTLPKGRAHLYDECIEVLLERWREGKELAVAVSSEFGRRALQPAALWLHGQKGKGEEGRTLATASELVPTLEPALKAARWQGTSADFLHRVRDESGLLTGWGPEHFGFMHLGFQEYLAASEVRRRAGEGDSVPLRELAAQYGVSWWQEVILVLLSMSNPSMFERFMREVVKEKAFGETLEPMGLILEDAVEISEAPFVELLSEAPGKDQEFWQRQLHALQVLERMGARAHIDMLREQLAQHPSKEIRLRLDLVTAAQETIGGTANELDERTGIELVRVAAGRFWMGSPVGQGAEWERPRHEVTIAEFQLGRYPVTNEQYGRFLQSNPKGKEPEYWADRRCNQARQPVVGVSWEDAQAYAEWAALRLPTEAEWEYACRAGTETQYSSGDTEQDLDRVGWFSGNSNARLHEVGEKPPNAFGLCDMHGNVWEWCLDYYRHYADPVLVGSMDPNVGVRVVRGGSWVLDAQLARSASRSVFRPVVRYESIGFRLARSLATNK
jgi:formylglycine-generating enzyme required for sulfatase activity